MTTEQTSPSLNINDIYEPSDKVGHIIPENDADELLAAFVGGKYHRYYRKKW